MTDIPGLGLATWQDVLTLESWDRDHVVIDTAGQSLAALQAALSMHRQG